MAAAAVGSLLDWCLNNGIRIDPNIRILHDEKLGICVRSANRPISPKQSLVVIPKSAVLSTRSCALANHIPHAPYGQDATLALALALYSEQLLQTRSRWTGYLLSLPNPQNWDGIALFWGVVVDLHDLREHSDASGSNRVGSSSLDLLDNDAALAKRWLYGTEAQAHLFLPGSSGTPLLDEFTSFYYSIAAPLLERAGLSPSKTGFLHACALVSSRAFMVDAYHGLAMVPIADAFNHAQDNTIHLESDYDVCTSCGSLSECPHDADAREGIKALALRGDTADPENTCEMVANAAIAPGEEIFNTYGARLSNAELLVRYGFMLDANDNDILTWTIEEIWDAAGAALADCQPRRWNNEAGYGLCMEILRDWQYDVGWTDSELVIDTELDKNSNPLYMTADGVLSHKLWLAIALATLQRQGTNLGLAQTHQILRSMAWAQTQLERGQTMARSESIDEEDDEYRALDRLVRTIKELCARRLDRIFLLDVRQRNDDRSDSLGLHSAIVGKYIDDLDTAQQKTRLAVTLALGEISIIESCVAAWDELDSVLDPGPNRHC
ncbi:hypothetical protein BGW80DRAFT_67865 [Lactifluus volemus]|nr:hypothetical protein BGW80DRAFT_67865 [Lactifluus volemus]